MPNQNAVSSPNRNQRKKGVPHTHATLLPGRPPAEPWGGPVPAAAGSTQPRTRVRAICCSGGGIRSAAFSLGGLQRLNEPEDGGGSIYQDTDFVTSVSGGGYIAASYALLNHAALNHAAGSEQPSTPAYRPGSIEDNRLRAHTRYLVDSGTQLAFSIMGILYGLLLNLLAVLAAVLVLATAVGYALGQHGLSVLRRNGAHWQTHFPSGLCWTLIGIAAAGTLIYLIYRVFDPYRPFSDDATKRWCGVALFLLCCAGLGALLFLGVPWLLEGLGNVPVQFHRASAGIQTGTLAGTVVALAAVVKQVLLSYQKLSKSELAGLVEGKAGKARGLPNRIATAALPWLGTALVVFMLLICLITWVSTMATPGGNHELQFWLAVAASGVLLVWPILTDCNDTSLHRYYAQRLATAFAVLPDGQQDRDQEKLSDYKKDKPSLVICAAVNTDQPGGTPSGRKCAPFTFSPHKCGISSGTMFGAEDEGGFDLAARESGGPDRRNWEAERAKRRRRPGFGLSMPTPAFETHARHLLLRDLIAVSGAAVSPAMGRMSKPSLRLVLGIANVRLGMWLPNPLRTQRTKWRSRLRSLFRRPGLPELWREMVGGMTLHTQWVYVTDGGHYENLGLVEALRRGATEIFVLDASGDQPFSLSTFGEAVETARADLGVEIRFADGDDDPLGLQADVTVCGRPVAKALAAKATATYANNVQATIYLCKAAFTDGLSKDISCWAAAHKDFPNDSTGNQLYGDREFEAYRQLGYEAATQACRLRSGPPPVAEPLYPPAEPSYPDHSYPHQRTPEFVYHGMRAFLEVLFQLLRRAEGRSNLGPRSAGRLPIH